MRSLVLASLFVSASAMACPDLSGTYPVCRSNTNSNPDQNMVISQSVVDGVTVYSTTSTDSETGDVTTDTLAADGKEVVETSPDGLPITLKYTASCTENALVMNLGMAIGADSIGTITASVTKEGNALVTRTTGTVMGEDVSEETICE